MTDEENPRAALRLFTYGLYVLGIEHEGDLEAVSVTWVTQASFKPRLLVMGVRKDGRPFSLLQKSRRFALSLLEAGQRDLAFAFFKPVRVEGDRIGGHPFDQGESRAPILREALGWIEGIVVSVDERGDHAVVIAEVTRGGLRRKGTPLVLRDLGLTYGG